ncbi:MAG: efflux RND transporter periplasmic adaptor subunit [Muribaculaceae bacterium]|nr:efflux RND transporter periplasmic adaptor subunit [Muribaculaceae bacterium]
MEMQVKVKSMDVERLKAEAVNERRLDSIGSGTGDRVRQAEFAYETGCLELAQLRQQLESSRQIKAAELKMKKLELDIFDKNMNEKRRTFDDASLRSPRKATLTFITDQIGRQIAEGEKVAVISDLSRFRVTGEISDSYADRVAIGSNVVVRSGKTSLTGKITRLTPQSRNGVIEFSVSLDNDDHPRLRSGLKTEVYVLCDVHDNAVRIPSGPYFKGPGLYDMFVTENGKLNRRKVQLGDSNYDFVEVVSGIVPGDSVVTSDMTEFKSRSSVKLK